MPFVLHESLLWFLPLIGLPVLIHLINMLRHRRVQWAAMEFLLASQKKHRKWIILKQLLLLLLRMTAVAAVVFMAAQPLLRAQWGALFGGSRTHHIVLLDDSFSMSDRWATTSAFDQARQVVAQIASQAMKEETPQTFTLLRFSRSRRGAAGTQPDLLQVSVQASFQDQLEKTLGALHVSESAAGPEEALEAIDGLPAKPDDENRVITIVSDFRTNQWDEPKVLLKTLQRNQQSGAQIRLVNVVETARPNLAIAALKPVSGVRAAGVPLLMEVAVQNFGTSTVKNVSVRVEEDGQTRPGVDVEEIPAGKAVTRRFPVLFSTAGQHEVVAHLESDAVEADNARYAVLDLAGTVPVLIVDGDAKAEDGFFIASALAPGGKVNSGLKPVIETTRALRAEGLDKYAAVILANVERLDPAEIEALENYAKGGGGVAFFLGEHCRSDFYNRELYRDGAGIFPLPLGPATELLVDRLDKAPDLEVTDHPIFSVFAGQRNSFISAVMVERYFTAAKNWQAPSDSTVKVIARLRNQAPLAVEQKFGSGRVVAFLTKASPVNTPVGTWNNWGRNNPSYVVALLELEAYLAAGRQAEVARTVGAPLRVAVDPGKFQPQVRFVLPHHLGSGAPSDTLTIDAEPAAAGLSAQLGDTNFSGIYQAQLSALDGQVDTQRTAYNVVPEEGNLQRLDRTQLAARLPGLKYDYHEAGEQDFDSAQLAGLNLGDDLMILLIVILLGEQVLAYAASYHPSKGGMR